MRIVIALLVLIIGLMAYVRLAPTDIAKWHQMPAGTAPGDTTETGGFRAVRTVTAPGADVLEAVLQQALATPRTVLLAGNVEEGMMTFQTRSGIWGFPDYTTVAVQDDLLIIYGRLRFGSADLGVNRARIEGWLEALAPLTRPL